MFASHTQSVGRALGQAYLSSALPGSLEQPYLEQSRPLCRCRVMYLGSSVPHITKNGLHGIQEPLRHLYPEEQFCAGSDGRPEVAPEAVGEQAIDISHLSASLGIDSWLSVWSNGLLLENFDEFGRQVRRFFAIDSLHYCAAVRFFDAAALPVLEQTTDANNNEQEEPPLLGRKARFLPLDAPIFRAPGMVDARQPPVFAAIMRRTTGVKVLECHAFICRRDAAANALVRCCTQAYADLLSARRLSAELSACRSLTLRPASYRQVPVSYGYSGPPEARAEVARLRQKQPNSSTEASNEDNSMENSSGEDNYAIITKQHHRAAKPATGKRAKGSSKSLFSDFAPPPSTLAPPSGEGEKLSHSLDLLELSNSASAATCCGDQRRGEAEAEARLAGGRAKRHSKSLQNLDLARDSLAETRGSRPRRTRRDSAAGSGRKAQSIQDMRAEQQSCADRKPLEDLVGRKGGERRRDPSVGSSTVRSRRRQHSPGGRRRGGQPAPAPASSTCGSTASANTSQFPSACRPPYPQPHPLVHAHHLQPAHVMYQPAPMYLAPASCYYPSGQPMYAAPMYPPPPPDVAALYPTHYSAHAGGLARFRCLSPPMQLLARDRPPAGRTRVAPDAGRVVSAEPSFVSSAATLRRKKLGWIKRLSLTMAATSPSLDPSASASGAPDAPPAAKKGGLFAGSLTLNRIRRAPQASAAQ